MSGAVQEVATSLDDSARRSIDAMLRAESIAIVGATERDGYGARFLNNLIRTKTRARLYPVNPRRETVFGLRCYSSAADLPEPVDLAAVIVAADQVVPSFREIVTGGARAALVVSAGFAEAGTQRGRDLQSALRDAARESGVRVCGPNCLGFANVADRKWITSSPRIDFDVLARPGAVALVSQSGATCYSTLLAMANDRGIGFRYLVATGNEADLESTDFMQYLLRDPDVKSIAAVVEGFKDGAQFVRTAELAAELGKPIVVLKIGRSEAGARGASSHTAAMTGSDVVHEALFRQKAVVRVDDYDELLETAAMFSKVRAPRGARVLACSESGGMACFTADKCGELGLDLPPLSAPARDALLGIMGDRGSAANPADLTMFGNGPDFPRVLEAMLRDDEKDIVVMSTIGGEPQARGMVDAVARTDKPLLLAWTGSVGRSGIELLRGSDVPLFQLPGKAALAARRLVDYHRTRNQLVDERAKAHSQSPHRDEARHAEALAQLHDADGAALDEHRSKKLLAAYGIACAPEALCHDRASARRAAERYGYPVAMKVVSADLLHKTEAGGVRLGIDSADALDAAFGELQGALTAHAPGARLTGMLVQPMITPVVEVIAGISRDEQFGPVLMVGMGGILAEVLGAVAWRVCPVNHREAREMLQEVKGLTPILEGYRRRPAGDVEALIDSLVRLSQLASEHADSIESIDVNPIAVGTRGSGALALDALVVPSRSALRDDRERVVADGSSVAELSS